MANEIKERPILFNDEMVRAYRDRLKTQTRRTRNLQKVNARSGDWLAPVFDPTDEKWVFTAEHGEPEQVRLSCPYGRPGDRLWIREAHAWADWHIDGIKRDGRCVIAYRADEIILSRAHEGAEPWQRVPVPLDSYGIDFNGFRWRPSIHMPRWASRTLLEITDIRVERVQDVSRGDAMEEGCPFQNMQDADPVCWFRELWDSINAKRGYGWNANPWVWVVEFPEGS